MKKHRILYKICVIFLSTILLFSLVLISQWLFMLCNKDLALKKAIKVDLPQGYNITNFNGISIKFFRAKIEIPADKCAQFVKEMNAAYHDGTIEEIEDVESYFPENPDLSNWWDMELSKIKYCWEEWYRGSFDFREYFMLMFLEEDTAESGETVYYFYISKSI